jgi:hypothetical protein
MAPPLHAPTDFHALRARSQTMRLPTGVGLLIGAGLSIALWSALIAGARALVR